MVRRKAKGRAPQSRAVRDPWQSKGPRKRKVQRRQALLYPLGVIAEAMPQIVWTADPDGYQDYFNKMWFTYTGLTKHETYTGKKSAIHPEDFPRYVRQWKKALRTGKPYREAYRFLQAADKQYRWHIVSGSALRDEHGRIIKWIGTFTDVHDEHEREREFRETNERLALAQKASRTGFWEWNIETDVLTWSRELYELFAFPLDAEATFDLWLSRLHPDDRVLAADNIQRSIDRRKRLESDYRVILPDGEERWIRAAGNTYFSPKGKPVRMLGTCIDITELKRGEERLRKLNRMLRAISNSTQTMMRGLSEEKLLGEICTILIRDCGYAMVWIGYAQENAQRDILPVCSAGDAGGYLRGLNLSWADVPRGRGPTGRAIREGKMVMCRNMRTDPVMAPWRKVALKHGFASSIALPLRIGRTVIGVINVYAREVDPFTADEVRLLKELANDLSHGIAQTRLRGAHQSARKKLQESEKRYRSLFQGMTEGFALHEIVCDANGKPCDYRFLEVNPAFERLTGLRAEDVLGRRVTEVLPGNDQEWIDVYGKVALSRRSVHFERYSSALKRLYEVYAYSPAPRQFATLFMDITVRKRAEEVLRVSEEKLKGMNEELERNVAERTRQLLLLQEQDRANLQRLRDIVENMGMAAMASDEHHMILFVNRQFCELFGYPSPDALVGRDGRSELQRIQSLFDDPKATVGLLLRNWNEGTTSMGQEVRFKDGRIFARDYIPVHSEGKHRGQLVLYRDVTKERRIDAAKSDFMSFASHQLRTPLTAVRWAVGRMKRSLPPGGEAERLAETARLAAQSMADTINTMLSVSRIEAGTVTLTPETFRVTDLFQEAVDVLHEEWHSRGQTIEIRCRKISIRTDQKLLREILTNLLTNAIKYSPTGSPIVLSACREGEYVRIDVRDKGLGIPEGEQAKVFQKFYRGTNAAQMLADGSGLGLYLVSLLVRTLGGTISFTSTEGEGTTFTVLLPGRRG